MKNRFYGALIVLANEMDSEGNLNQETRARVDRACREMSEGNAKSILLMGWNYRPDTSLCISDSMFNYVQREYRIDPARVLIDRQSRDTVGDAIFSKRDYGDLIRPRAICVVTSDYHRQRAKTIFDFVYGEGWIIDIIGVPTHKREDMEISESASLNAFRQTFSGVESGDDSAIFKALAEKHPYYNGTVYPRIVQS